MSAATSSRRQSKQDEDDLAAIDGAIDRMRAFTPTDPYILTIPQDVEPRYHHLYKYQATQWLDHTPFEAREHESTQYQTFIYHEPGKDIFMLHNSQPADTGKNSHRAGVATGANTPSGSTAPKKKISLTAYKMKQGAAATPDRKESEQQAKQPAVKGPIERLKADEEVLAAVEGGEDSVPASPPKEDKKDLKRKRENISASEQVPVNGEIKDERSEDEARSKKARRTSSSPKPTREDTQPQRRHEDNGRPPASADKSKLSPAKASKESILPPKLSPPPAETVKSQLPRKLSPITTSSALPPRLSPTLPANIAATLKERAHQRSTSSSSDLLGLRSASKDAATRHLTPPPKSIPRNGFRANSGSPAVRSDLEDRGRPAVPVAREAQTPDPDSEASEEIVVSKGGDVPKKQHRRLSSSEKRSLVIKLKYKKSQRESIRRILNLRPNPDTAFAQETDADEVETATARAAKRPSKTSDARQREQRDANGKGIAQKVGPNSSANGINRKEESNKGILMERKRSRSDDSDPDTSPSKRMKIAPDSTESKSRLHDNLSAPRPTSQPLQNTMRKDVLSATMKRERSNDSSFGGSHAHSQTSPSVQGSHTSQPSNENAQASVHTVTTLEKAWRAEGQRLEALGKDLKQAATDHSTSANNSEQQPTKLHNLKLAATKSLEAFLSFLLSFTCDDQARLASDPKLPPNFRTWRTLQGFYSFVKRHCEPFPHLYGLACALGMVFTARILELATQQRPDPTSTDASYVLRQYDSTLDVAAQMRRAANEADAKLDIDILQSSFPRAWAGRTKGLLEKDTLEVKRGFAGKYKLPFGIQMTPLRAARAGYAVLEEWIEKEKENGEGLGYGMKLKL